MGLMVRTETRGPWAVQEMKRVPMLLNGREGYKVKFAGTWRWFELDGTGPTSDLGARYSLEWTDDAR